MNEKRLQIHIVSRTQLIVGVILTVLGLCMPLFWNVSRMGIYPRLALALAEAEKTYVLEASMLLWILNSIRNLPIYLGAFYLADTITPYYRGAPQRYVAFPLLACIIFLEYNLIDLLYHDSYVVSVPLILMLLFTALLIRVDFSLVSLLKKAITVTLLLCTVQSLDTIPLLIGKGFGLDDVSTDIGSVISFLDAATLVNSAIFILTIVLAISSVLYITLLHDENRIKLDHIRRQQQERQLAEARTHLELQHLVHDLKTPLTSMQTLVGLLQLRNQDLKSQEYLNNVEFSIGRLNELISEFLDEQQFSPYRVQDIVADVMAQISNMPYVHVISCHLPEEELWVEINRVRFSRMMVNLFENAYYAMDPEQGHMDLTIYRETQQESYWVCFSLTDNGKGIESSRLSYIFENGYSTRGSSGLGLGFVREVVECHKGQIQVSSQVGRGTTFIIRIPEGGLS